LARRLRSLEGLEPQREDTDRRLEKWRCGGENRKIGGISTGKRHSEKANVRVKASQDKGKARQSKAKQRRGKTPTDEIKHGRTAATLHIIYT